MGVVSPVLYSIITVLGLLGNGLVMYIVSCKRKSTAVDALVLNLAIADFLYCLSLPILARNLLRDMIWDLGLIACKATSAFTMLNLYASVWLLVAMSFDRYFAVCNPVKARQLRNKTNINLMIISCWIFASLLTIPAWIWRNLYSFGPNQLASSQQNHTDLSNSSVSTTITVIVSNYTTSSNQSEYIDSELDDFSNMTEIIQCMWIYPNQAVELACYLLRLLLSFVLPVGMIIICYTKIVSSLSDVSSITNQRRDRITRTIFIVVVCFIMSWLPNHIFSVYVTFVADQATIMQQMHLLKSLNAVTQMLASSNSAMNPFIYAFSRKPVKTEMLSIISRIIGRNVSGKSVNELPSANTVQEYVSEGANLISPSISVVKISSRSHSLSVNK